MERPTLIFVERPTIWPRTVYSRGDPMQFDGRAEPLHSLEVLAGSVSRWVRPTRPWARTSIMMMRGAVRECGRAAVNLWGGDVRAVDDWGFKDFSRISQEHPNLCCNEHPKGGSDVCGINWDADFQQFRDGEALAKAKPCCTASRSGRWRHGRGAPRSWAIATGCECCVFGRVVFVMATVGIYAVLYALRGYRRTCDDGGLSMWYSRLCFYFPVFVSIFCAG